MGTTGVSIQNREATGVRDREVGRNHDTVEIGYVFGRW